MISFWVGTAGRFGIEEYLARRNPTLLDQLRVFPYEDLKPELELESGAHIFAGLCQLSPAGHDIVAALYDQLRDRSPTTRVLNDPRSVLRRFELLTRMHAEGINRFRAYRATSAERSYSFPVFVREEAGHDGPLTGLLHNNDQVIGALRGLRVRGYQLDQLLVVEFCDMADAAGIVRMASIYRIGDHIVPAFQLRGRNWMLKWSDSDHDEPAMGEFVSYVRDNPDESWARNIFTLANIDYGRLDYGICGQNRQVWEINLNPTVGPPPGPEPPALPAPLEDQLQDGRAIYNKAMLKAFRSLDSAGDNGKLRLRLDPRRLAQMQGDTKRRRRRAAALEWMRRLSNRPWLGWPLRVVASRLLPRR